MYTSIPLSEVPTGLLPIIDEVARKQLRRADATGVALAAQVARLSALYTRTRDDIGGDDASNALLAARLRFFLPRDLPKIMLPLAELLAQGALPGARRPQVLDLGAGLGATCLGAARFGAITGAWDGLDVVAVDPFEPGLRLLSALAARAEEGGLVPTRVSPVALDMGRRLPAGPFDLVLFGLSLNEWSRNKSAAEAADLVERAAGRLTDDGAIIILEPALKREARFLQETRDELAKRGRLAVFAPCRSAAPCPMLPSERDWCHTAVHGELATPLAEIARAAGLRRSRLTFSYLTLRRRRPNSETDGALTWPEGSFRVVSDPRPTKGKLELFVCGGGELVRLMRLKRQQSPDNAGIDEARRGDLLTVRGPLVPDRARLRIGPEHTIRRQAPGDEDGPAQPPPNTE